MLAGPGMPALADSRMSVLTLTSQGVPTLLGSNTACSKYMINFLLYVFIYISRFVIANNIVFLCQL